MGCILERYKMAKPKVVTGWHILDSNGTLRYDAQRPLINEWTRALFEYVWWRSDITRTVLCQEGMHACRDLLDALQYRSPQVGAYICRVQVTGSIQETKDKLVGIYRKILWYVKLSQADVTVLDHMTKYIDDEVSPLSHHKAINAALVKFIMSLPKLRRQTAPILKGKTKYQKPRTKLLNVKDNRAKLYSGTKLFVSIKNGNAPYPYINKAHLMHLAPQ